MDNTDPTGEECAPGVTCPPPPPPPPPAPEIVVTGHRPSAAPPPPPSGDIVVTAHRALPTVIAATMSGWGKAKDVICSILLFCGSQVPSAHPGDVPQPVTHKPSSPPKRVSLPKRGTPRGQVPRNGPPEPGPGAAAGEGAAAGAAAAGEGLTAEEIAAAIAAGLL